MIIAIVLAEPLAPVDGEQPYFLDAGGASVLERAVSRVLRGPFGGTIVATSSDLEADCREALSGFAVQYAVTDDPATVAKAGLLEAAAFRKRWEKAMALASQRFGAKPGKKTDNSRASQYQNTRAKDDDEDGSDERTDWKGLQKNSDVKIRGLARSFDIDGIMLFRGERAGLKLETQALLIDTFTREANNGATQPLARIVANGRDAYPVLANLAAAKELENLPLSTRIDTWLASQSEKVLHVNSDDPAVGADLKTAADFTAFEK